ncbi:MAG: hypothetical protein IJ702_01380 [Fretibacterium sp.]|nr:hypothetical protein [Fretibacterium sp.]
MYFLWKRTQHGVVQISGEGLADFIRGFLTAKCRLCGLALAAGHSLHPAEHTPCPADDPLTLVLSFTDASCQPAVERKLSFLMKPLGLTPLVIWARPEDELLDLLKSPWLWMALASSIALTVIAGWAGFFWTTFWGTAAWFVTRGLVLLCRLASRRGQSPDEPLEPDPKNSDAL